MNCYLMNNQIRKRKDNNHGTTLIEMVVCFALLGIFMACAAALISSITQIYYSIKGEMGSREVSDIVMDRIVSEIDGAKYFGSSEAHADDNPTISADEITLCDKTDTRVSLSMDDGKLIVHYFEKVVDGSIGSPNSRYATDWSFDDSFYKGFYLTNLSFYRGGGTTPSNLNEYGLADVNLSQYPTNVVLVLMEMKNDRYSGVYRYYRFITMYNVPDEQPPSGPEG